MAIQGHQLAAAYRQQASELSSLIDAHRGLIEYVQQRDAEVVRQLEAAQRELAAVYLPALTDENLERVAKLTGFQGFTRRDLRAAIAQERKVLQTAIGKLEAEERYQQRDALVGATGTLSEELRGSQETLTPLQAECDRFETLPDFATLIAVGYDTPSFQDKWWQASYWKHWAAGDRVCKQLGMKDFGDDVIPAYNKVAEPRNFMRLEVERLTKEIDAIHELVREHDRLADRLNRLEDIYLVEAQEFLGQHLVNADAALLEQWAAAEPDNLRAVQMGVRKIAGMQAKRSFLSEIGKVGVPQTMMQLVQRERKAEAKAAKFSRPKHSYASFPDSSFDPSFQDKSRSMQGQLDKLRRRIDHLVENQHYAAFDMRNDQQLWWLYFMHSHPPARYAPNLYEYYERRPDISVVTDPAFADDVDVGEPEPGDAAARAFGASEALDQGGYLS